MTQVITFTSNFSVMLTLMFLRLFHPDYGSNFIGGKGCLRVRGRRILELTFGATVPFVGVCFQEGATHVMST
jgi:hypothetical protein